MSGASIYLDHNSTTPIDPRVVETMARAWKDCGANPASQHSLGRQARRMLEQAREGILELLGAKTGGMGADQLIFTSGGTEANNLALFGLVALASESAAGDLKPATGNSVALFVSPIEHPSISTPVPVLRKQGCQVISMPVNDRGLVDFSALPEQALAQKPRSVASVMLANNETGVVQPIAEIARQWRERVC